MLVILILPILLAVLGRLRADLAALIIAASLGILPVIGCWHVWTAQYPRKCHPGLFWFSQPAVITLMGLFILTRSLDQVGVVGWVAARIIRVGGQSEARLVVLFAGTTALFSLLMNNVAAGASSNAYGLSVLIGVRVVEEWDGRAPRPGAPDRRGYLGRIRGRTHEVYIVTTPLFKVDEDVGQRGY